MTDNPAPVFAHAMWRSGSTYLASRFAASGRYMLFYEPFHEGVGRKPSAARLRDRARDRQLRHPTLEGGYFSAYEQQDPRDGRPLTAHFSPDASLRNVYNDASEGATAYLAALIATAQQEHKTAFLGFCRAGTQAAVAQALLGGRGLHLWRAPREQFGSYDWPANDYFMGGTLLQLGYSRRLGDLARTLAPQAFASLRIALARRLPDARARWQYRLVRPVAQALTPAQSYGLFFLSWLACYQAGRAASEFSVSLTQLAVDAPLRRQVEQSFGIDFSDLRPTPARAAAGLAYEAIEDDVLAKFSALTGTPVKLPE